MAHKTLYRHDGVKIMHDPYAPGMAEKYGIPGETDREGFDPYADTVGPGIYGGIVKRDSSGQIIIGKQYQNHNPRPGPVYAGGGYTPMAKALGDNDKVKNLLKKYPDLVNDISTGGAQPLHNCGMSRQNQYSTETLIRFGADIEALDTYGYTPLHRMASNNLGVGARALLSAGADPLFKGNNGQTPMQVARGSGAMDVVRALQEHGQERKDVRIQKIVVEGAGQSEVNGEYLASQATTIPDGFDLVCQDNSWKTDDMWERLNGGREWYKHANGAYIYFNLSDNHWWIDAPKGQGIFKAPAPAHAPPQTGWVPLGDSSYLPVPSLVATFRALDE